MSTSVSSLPQSSGFFLSWLPYLIWVYKKHRDKCQGSHLGIDSDLPKVPMCQCLGCSQKSHTHSSFPWSSCGWCNTDAAFSLRFAATPTVEMLPHPSLFCSSLISLLKARTLLTTLKFVLSSLMSATPCAPHCCLPEARWQGVLPAPHTAWLEITY